MIRNLFYSRLRSRSEQNRSARPFRAFLDGFSSLLRLHSGEPFDLGKYPRGGLSSDVQALASDLRRVQDRRRKQT